MKKPLICLMCLALSLTAVAQSNILQSYKLADSLLKAKKISEAHKIFSDLSTKVDKKDSIYASVIWYDVATAALLINEAKMKEDFTGSLKYALDALKLIRENKALFDEKFAIREAYTVRDIVVSYMGLGKIEDAKKYMDILYKGYKEHTLPKGLEGYFNFDFFVVDNKNVWGYEWYPELPDDRFSQSFTKIVYYVQSRNADGSDKDQLYRLHVLMFHHDKKDATFDYILEKQQENNSELVSGSYYRYTYKKDIDYRKLRADVKEIITTNMTPDTKRILQKR